MIHLKKIALITAVISVTAVMISCKKDVDLPIDTCVAGTGGEVMLVLQPEHHGVAIPSIPGYPDSAFIKFNVNEFPGDNPDLYDLVVTGNEGDNYVVVTGLKCGSYYIYMTGKDTSLDERVRGGIPYSFEETSGVKVIKIPITED